MSVKNNSISYKNLGLISILMIGLFALALPGCSDQSAASPVTSSSLIQQSAYNSLDIDETMQFSPHKINLQSTSTTSESVQAIISVVIPSDYHISDFAFTLSFNGEAVVDAYDFYYCYIDNNLVIYFNKSEVIASPVTQALANTTVVAAVDGYFTASSDTDSFTVDLSTVAEVEIIRPSQKNNTVSFR
ncbi:MAG TPA: hypothetical protein PLF13_05355 [candidate division Zixibacteria bacterium]|nr:hypothetical protein [candidate division Zixibacteria bacterium]